MSVTRAASCHLLYLFTPNHLIHYSHITLNDLHHLGGDILVGIVRYWGAIVAIADEFYGCIYCLKESLCIDTGQDKSCFIERLRTLGGGADADGWERMTYTCEEAAFLWEGAAIGNDCKGIHL